VGPTLSRLWLLTWVYAPEEIMRVKRTIIAPIILTLGTFGIAAGAAAPIVASSAAPVVAAASPASIGYGA
jgi:hypothetical protein